MVKKVSKKHQRLSPKAKKLIGGAKEKFSHDPSKAVEYLQSVESSEFNEYDRAKIGREILARLYPGEARYGRGKTHTTHASDDKVKKIEGIEREYGIDGWDDELTNLKEKSNLLKKANKIYKFTVEQLEKYPEVYSNYEHFTQAAELYETGGYHDKALLSLEKAKENPRATYRQGERIKRLESLLEKSDKKKSRKAKVTSIIAIAGLGAGIFFLSNNITGNVVGNLTQNSSNYIGVIALAIGLVAGYFYIKKK